MGFEVENASETLAKVRIRVERSAVEEAVEHELGHLKDRARLPGFRPGKVPKQLLAKRFGSDVTKDVRRKLLVDALQHGILERKLHPVDPPSFKEEDLIPKADGSLAVDLDLEVIPHVEPTGYDRFTVTPPPIEWKDEELDRELEQLRRQAAQADDVKDGEAIAGDVVIADLALSFLDGSSLPSTLENRIVDSGAGMVDGVACEDAKTKFNGCRRGDKIRVSMKLPDQFPVEEHRGKTAITDCAVKEIRRVSLPALDSAAFHQRLGVKDLDDLKAKLRERMEKMKQSEQDRAIEDLCVDQLLERHKFALPDAFLQRNIEAERERVRRDLVNRGLPPPDVERQLLEIEGRVKTDVERRIREQYVLDRVAEKLETQVSGPELEQQFVLMARMWQVEPQKLYEHFDSQGMVPRVVEDIRRAKVRRQLREAAAPVENEAKKA